MRVGALILGIVTATAPILPLHGEPPAGNNTTNHGALVRDVVLRSNNGANQSAAFSNVAIQVAPGDLVVEAGGNVRRVGDDGPNGANVLLLGHVSGTDVFKGKNRFMNNNPHIAIIDRGGRLVPGSGIASLVRKNEATGDETVFTDASLLEDRYGIAVEDGAGSASPGGANAAYSVVGVEVDYHGNPIVTIEDTGGDYRRLHLIKELNTP